MVAKLSFEKQSSALTSLQLDKIHILTQITVNISFTTKRHKMLNQN